jgi:hypothetical protein
MIHEPFDVLEYLENEKWELGLRKNSEKIICVVVVPTWGTGIVLTKYVHFT